MQKLKQKETYQRLGDKHIRVCLTLQHKAQEINAVNAYFKADNLYQNSETQPWVSLWYLNCKNWEGVAERKSHTFQLNWTQSHIF